MSSVLRLLALSLMLLVASPVQSKSKLYSDGAALTPDAGKALVVFLRPSSYGALIASTVYDVSAEATVFLGEVDNKTKLGYQVAPGAHRFMVMAENADFMEATLDAGKTYYVLVSPRVGMWKARFSLLPVRNRADAKYSTTSEDFAEWQSKTRWVVKNAAADAWYDAHRDDIAEKQAKYLKKWDRMLPADKANLTMTADDGI